MLPAFQGSWPALGHRWAGIAGLQRPLRHGQALPVRREAMAPMCPQGQHPDTNRFAQGPQARCPLQPATVATSPTGRHTQADRPERSSALGTAIPSMGGAMAQRPHIGRDGGKLGLRELGASHGGIGGPYSFGFGTPLAIVRVMDARLPSPHSHLPLVRPGPWGVPLHPCRGSLRRARSPPDRGRCARPARSRRALRRRGSAARPANPRPDGCLRAAPHAPTNNGHWSPSAP
jgi:hypothetical protein